MASQDFRINDYSQEKFENFNKSAFVEEFLHMLVEPRLVPPRHVVYLALLKNNQVIVPLGNRKM